jgi:hypothetical protein
MQVVSVVSVGFFRAKIESAVQRFGTNSFCSSVAEIAEMRPEVIIVDLEHPKALEVLRTFGKSAIAFGPHTDLLAIGKQFGAKVYPRSIFFSELDNILHQYA